MNYGKRMKRIGAGVLVILILAVTPMFAQAGHCGSHGHHAPKSVTTTVKCKCTKRKCKNSKCGYCKRNSRCKMNRNHKTHH